jgi:hypothetical protein
MHQSTGEMQVMMEGGGASVRSMACNGMLASILSIPPGTDFTPALKGLPDDLCPSEHWGHVLSGSIMIRYADGTTETTKAGESFHWPAGHTAISAEGCTFFEVSPEKEMRQLLDHITGGGA